MRDLRLTERRKVRVLYISYRSGYELHTYRTWLWSGEKPGRERRGTNKKNQGGAFGTSQDSRRLGYISSPRVPTRLKQAGGVLQMHLIASLN